MSDKWEWEVELKQAHLNQTEVGLFLGLSKSQMSHLVNKMIKGRGLTATALDNERWKNAVEYVAFKKEQVIDSKFKKTKRV
ncbi:hypothetical protein [Companilactobacillus sp. FL22-1]|uniref:hypothetical protein n=1 Tax=Companilactobacillus sp. FL22-1 TaxID=3373892 RepID=UPI0037540887